jgi:hypothetical protein
VQADGEVHPLALDLPTVCTLFRQAVDAAARQGLSMRTTDLVPKPQDKLLELVRRSRHLALRGEGEPDE